MRSSMLNICIKEPTLQDETTLKPYKQHNKKNLGKLRMIHEKRMRSWVSQLSLPVPASHLRKLAIRITSCLGSAVANIR